MSAVAVAADGRDTRWVEHRERRRRELIESTLRAIRHHGAAVGMDDIAAAAGTSKTVIYRHFGGRTGLYLAIVEAVDRRILTDLGRATVETDPDDVPALVAAMVQEYLQLVQKDPEIYRFVVTRPMLDGPVTDDPVASLTGHIGAEVAGVIEGYLRRRGAATDCATTWGHGIVGFIRAATDQWMAGESDRPAADVVAQVRAIFQPAFPPTPDRLQPTTRERSATAPTRPAPTREDHR